MTVPPIKVRRLTDGGIDFDYYRRRAVTLRRGRIRHLLRRRNFLRQALYAAAICVGLALGQSVPVRSVDCLNCELAGVDVDDVRASAIESEGYATLAGRIIPARLQ